MEKKGLKLLTREKLSQLSEEELEKHYQEKKEEFELKISKNRRIRGILSRKVDEKQKTVTNLKNDIEDFLSSHPEFNVAKQDFYLFFLIVDSYEH